MEPQIQRAVIRMRWPFGRVGLEPTVQQDARRTLVRHWWRMSYLVVAINPERRREPRTPEQPLRRKNLDMISQILRPNFEHANRARRGRRLLLRHGRARCLFF